MHIIVGLRWVNTMHHFFSLHHVQYVRDELFCSRSAMIVRREKVKEELIVISQVNHWYELCIG